MQKITLVQLLVTSRPLGYTLRDRISSNYLKNRVVPNSSFSMPAIHIERTVVYIQI